MGVPVTPSQEKTISAQAAAHLKNPPPPHLQIAGTELTQQEADKFNTDLAAAVAPLLAHMRTSLGLAVQQATMGGTRVLVITPRKRKRRRVAGFFVHGGGFALASADDYNAYRMAHDLGIVVYSVDYSLSPGTQFPDALSETFDAYRAVRRRYRRVLAAGSSAGANLLITTILRTRRGRRPEAAGLFCPAVDLRAIGDSYVANDGRDPLVTKDLIETLYKTYLGNASPTDPEASPILASYGRGFIPTVITTGTRDLLQSDSVRFYWKLRGAGVPVELRVWEGMWHAFEGVPDLPEGNEVMREVFGFLEIHL